jgi:flagellin-like hook-associated protein FlgL
MTLTLSSNLAANKASQNLNKASEALRNSLNRLSSGKRIVNSYDDPGGMSVAYKLQSRLRRTEAVRHNVQNGISFLQVQDGVLSSAGNIVSRMSELRTMAQDVTKNTSDIENYSKEFLELQMQLSQMYREKFNGVSLFSKSSASAISPPNGPVYNKGTSVDENGNVLTKFSRTIYTHDSGQMDDGSVSIGATNFEDVFNLGSLDTRYVPTFNGQFANLSNPGGLNAYNYSTEGATGATSTSGSSGTDSTSGATSSVPTSTLTSANPGAASAAGMAFYMNDGDPATMAYDPDSDTWSNAFSHNFLPDSTTGRWDIFVNDPNGQGTLGNSYSLEILDRQNEGGTDNFSKLGGGEAITYTNDGHADFRLSLANAASLYSMVDIKNILDATGVFYVSIGSLSSPSTFRLSDNFDWSGNPVSGTGQVWANNNEFTGGAITTMPVDPSFGGMRLGFYGGSDNPPAPSTDSSGTGSTDSGSDSSSSVPTFTAADESTTPDQNAEVFTDDGYLSSILFVSMSQFTAVIERIADARAENGAEQSRLQMVDELLATNVTNLEAAHGRIMDADVAAESTKFARYNVMAQAAASMVAQANQLSSIALTLLGR